MIKAIRKDDTNAVLIDFPQYRTKLWMDVEVKDNDVICDWNKYIFHLDNTDGLLHKAIQENPHNFEEASSVAVEYLQECDVLHQDEQGNWSCTKKSRVMKKKVFYVVDFELEDIDGVVETTGHKTISLYTIEKDDLECIGTIDCTIEDNTIEEIEEFLNDNGFEDEEVELKHI